MCDCVCVCVQNRKQALLTKWRWSTESCSRFKHHLFISPLRGTHTHTHAVTNVHAETDILQFISSRTDNQPHSLILHPPRPRSPSALPSFRIDGVFCHPMLRFMQYSSKGRKKKLISHSMNFHKLSSAPIGKSRSTGLTHTHTNTLATTAHTNNPIIRAFGGEGFVFVPVESDSDLWRRAVTLHPIHTTTQSKVTGPNTGTKKRLLRPLRPQQNHTNGGERREFGVSVASIQPNGSSQLTQ